ncbi:putative addiction module antidote protein, CC2985 family [Fulvimarina manganoxydans]|uniref:Putative addiction module antidote protein, CC2985 family n=1 Tax=Fulvimarina manganoxydans TaxID=937218 RepID=A0A1W2EBK1_9HYPH|nr:type II toxin-antitoxin system ParD family antitoxin [Fulvimarina manganoxydans]SMD07045.1 putative addiction module antidote protein, CC2985 family [Fulvimarina manganoxydans]
MDRNEHRSIELTPRQADYVDEMVRSGSYASPSEVVQASLDALKEREDKLESWLRSDVAPIYDRMAADPDDAIPAEQVFSDLRERYGAP